jgi:hypothetical protein
MYPGGTSNPLVPSQSPGAGSPAKGSVAACAGTKASAILLIDEIGLPMLGVTVQVTIDGVTSTMTSDATTGILCFTQPPGTKVKIELADVHEGKPGESTKTPSGQHFKANGPGP